MYHEVFGGYKPELDCNFDTENEVVFEEFNQKILEAPIERPYEFCESVKNSKGK